MKYGIGIDIGGTKCAVLLGNCAFCSDKEKFILKKVVFNTRETGGSDKVISRFMYEIDGIMKEFCLESSDIKGIGISCGGPLNSQEGLILNPPNLTGWFRVPIADILEKRYGIPVVLENDANSCAVAEWKYGAGRGHKNVIFLTFGTGLGAGLILDGRLYRGSNNMAGEIGHIRLTECGPVGYGKMGSFEGFCSGSGISQLAKMKILERMQQGEEQKLCKIPDDLKKLDARLVAMAADNGDELAKEIFAMSGRYLGKGLSLLVDILNPEVIIIGSIFERNIHLLWPYAEKEMRKESLAASLRVCKVVPSELGDSIGDYAALSLAAYNF